MKSYDYLESSQLEIMGLKDTNIMNNVYSKLIIEWQKEKFSDDLHPYKEDLINKVSSLIDSTKENIDKNFSDENQFLKEIMELDLERLIFVLKDYLRIRIVKIEKYLYFIIKNDLHSILSNSEFEFAYDLYKIKKAYFDQNLNSKLIYKELVEFDKKISESVLVTPNKNIYTFVKCLSTESITINIQDVYPSNSSFLTLIKGEIYCLPESLVKSNCEISRLAYI